MKGNSDGPLLTYQTLILLVEVRVFNFNSILKKGRLSLLSSELEKVLQSP